MLVQPTARVGTDRSDTDLWAPRRPRSMWLVADPASPLSWMSSKLAHVVGIAYAFGRCLRLRQQSGAAEGPPSQGPVEQLGVLATLSRWRPRVQIPSGPLSRTARAGR